MTDPGISDFIHEGVGVGIPLAVTLFLVPNLLLELEAGLPPWFHQKSPHGLETPHPSRAMERAGAGAVGLSTA